jgi:hypothetical protein
VCASKDRQENVRRTVGKETIENATVCEHCHTLFNGLNVWANLCVPCQELSLDKSYKAFEEDKGMMCYRDMTFCRMYDTCKLGKRCPRALTPEVQAEAEEWWGNSNAPICMFVDTPHCLEPKEVVK